MLRTFITILSLCLFLYLLPAQETTLSEKWGGNTAFIMPKGKWESGIVQSFRYGLNDKIELRTHALLMPFLPNAGVKISYGVKGGFLLAGEHALSYPTLFLKMVSFKGTGGLISPQYQYPFLLSVDNTLIATKLIGISSLLTANAGLSFVIRGSKPDYQSTIDLPLLYPRMAHYYEGATFRAGLSFQGLITRKLFYEEHAQMFVITRDQDNFFTENSGTLMWALGRSLRIKGGYVLSWGKYPFGDHLQMWPTLDLVFGSRR